MKDEILDTNTKYEKYNRDHDIAVRARYLIDF